VFQNRSACITPNTSLVFPVSVVLVATSHVVHTANPAWKPWLTVPYNHMGKQLTMMILSRRHSFRQTDTLLMTFLSFQPCASSSSLSLMRTRSNPSTISGRPTSYKQQYFWNMPGRIQSQTFRYHCCWLDYIVSWGLDP
jgi:hypothetical protein